MSWRDLGFGHISWWWASSYKRIAGLVVFSNVSNFWNLKSEDGKMYINFLPSSSSCGYYFTTPLRTYFSKRIRSEGRWVSSADQKAHSGVIMKCFRVGGDDNHLWMGWSWFSPNSLLSVIAPGKRDEERCIKPLSPALPEVLTSQFRPALSSLEDPEEWLMSFSPELKVLEP